MSKARQFLGDRHPTEVRTLGAEGGGAVPGGEFEIFDDAFIQLNTRFTDFRSMLELSPLAGVAVDNLEVAVHSPKWNEFVNENSFFPTWEAMKLAAARRE